MVKLWNQESAQWRVELQADGEALSQRMGEQPRQLLVSLGEEAVTAERLRQAAAQAVKTVRDFGAESAVLDAAAAVEALGAEGLGALAQGAGLALYRQEAWKERKDQRSEERRVGKECL